MRVVKLYLRLPLFWKAFIFIVSMLTVVVGITEFGIERLLEQYYISSDKSLQSWHTLAWILMVLLPSLVAGAILSRILSVKLEGMAQTARELAAGNLKARMKVVENSNDALDDVARSFNEMAETLESQLHHERRMLADVSHELRAPLSRISLMVELIQRGREGEKCRDFIPGMEREVLNMKALVEQLLLEGKERVKDSTNTRPVELSRMLVNICRDFSQQGKARGITVAADIEEGCRFTGHPILLHRLFDNVLANALRFSPDDGTIRLTLRSDKHKLVVTIRDFGPGVPEEKLSDIFRPFHSLDAPQAQASGAGLGLALAMEAAIFHGGVIRAGNAHPGLNVTITLPWYIAEEDAPDA